MSSPLARLWHGRDVAIVYALIVAVATVVVAVQPPPVARDLIASSSTDLVNMRDRPLTVLVLSAFVISPAWLLVLLIPVVIAYGAVQRWLGRLAVVVTAVFGHVGATLCVTVAQGSALAERTVPASIAYRHDVGVSYGLAAALGLLLVRVPRRYRLAYGLLSLAVVVALFVFRSLFSGLGHGLAWVIGLGLAWLVYASARAPNAVASTSGADR